MVEIKSSKRKLLKLFHPIIMQVQGQLEVCDIDECDSSIKIEEYENYEEYTKDVFVNDDKVIDGRTS